MQEIIGIILRLSIMYLYALLLVRLSGKRTLGNLTAIDFVMTLVIGDLFDDAFWGTSPLSSTFVAMGVIVFWHTTIAALSARSTLVDHLVSGSTTTKIIENGRFIHAGMQKERTPEETVRSALRGQDVDRLEEVREGYWEPNGHLTIQKQVWAKDAEKQDLPILQKVKR